MWSGGRSKWIGLLKPSGLVKLLERTCIAILLTSCDQMSAQIRTSPKWATFIAAAQGITMIAIPC